MFLFRRLPSGGAFLVKPLGVLAFGYITWLLLFTRLFPNGREYLLLMMLAGIGTATLALRLRPELARAMRSRLRHILIGEAIFAVAFIAFAIFRAQNPDIVATEKPMDFALMNGVLRSESFPPDDPWLSGHSINYYYFGYGLAAAFTSMAAVTPEVGFNLALGTFFALVFLGMFSLGYDLTSLLGKIPRAAGWTVGAITAMLGTVAGNLYSFNYFLGERNRNPDFWAGIGWNASRVVQIDNDQGLQDYTINEFPSFSFILGDLHPHVMALPIAIVAVSLAVTWLVAWSRPEPGRSDRWVFAGLSGWVLGSLYVINAWDFPVFYLLVALAGLAGLYRRGEMASGRDLFADLGIAALVGVSAFLPFYLTFSPFASGFGLVSVRSEIGDFLLVFGLWATAAFAILIASLARGGKAHRWALIVGTVFVVMTWLVDSNISVILFCGIVVAGMVYLFQAQAKNPGRDAIHFLIFAGFGLAALPEVVFLRDFFGPPYQRMNTVFKIYYQAWPILAAAAVPAMYAVFRELTALSGHRRLPWEFAYSGILSALIFFAMSYPVIAGRARIQRTQDATLDGLDFARRNDPEEILAIEWLRKNAPRGSIITEATGNAYTEYARVSAWTGIPTIIGWDQHEQLWRKGREDVDERIADVDSLYGGLSRDDALTMLRRYNVSHVYVGRLEREKYGPGVDLNFAWMEVAYEVPGNVIVYKVPGT